VRMSCDEIRSDVPNGLEDSSRRSGRKAGAYGG
jgi:hypothetical protein